MPSYTQDAKRLSLLFDYGVATEREIIAWADSLISVLNPTPDALIELSLTPPTKTEDFITHLHVLSEGADFWPAFRAALARIHDHVVSRPQDAERISAALWHTALSVPGIPKDLNFAYNFDAAFSLARDGTYGNEDDVRREFLKELKRFTLSDSRADIVGWRQRWTRWMKSPSAEGAVGS